MQINFENGSTLTSIDTNDVIRGHLFSHVIAPKDFEYILCERKNGKKFIKVIMYYNDANGYIEVARINPIKNDFSEDGYGDIDHLFSYLEDNQKVISNIKQQLIK
ncbi:hypothetical protein FJQ98_16150 [Lysinibacillus agricola]|uniref:Pullulanase n=1 Tax=Lysinibacillus agricola TaxID=2590012 RepID=A0ABX7ALK2_9BACI|nr:MULTISPECIES: hypothetical protein [Lysinibacillus]KOS61525.1 hypothetical protein AN161_18220 [Lysinibacillus sp. FJAT-14222]QQP10778.1 hypothetical protein FJQ98_16150 [Lysinibacillus agricola]